MIFSISNILIGITCLVSYQAFKDLSLKSKLAHHPYSVIHRNEYYRLISSAFVHSNDMHLFLNMFALWMFGNAVEARFMTEFGPTMGAVNFVALYIASAVFADLPITQRHRDNPGYSSIGASGATSAIVLVYVLFSPWSWLLLFFIIPIPSIVAAVLYIIYSSKMDGNSKDNINHSAHLWGAISGVVIALIMRPSFGADFVVKLLDYQTMIDNFPY